MVRARTPGAGFGICAPSAAFLSWYLSLARLLARQRLPRSADRLGAVQVPWGVRRVEFKLQEIVMRGNEGCCGIGPLSR